MGVYDDRVEIDPHVGGAVDPGSSATVNVSSASSVVSVYNWGNDLELTADDHGAHIRRSGLQGDWQVP
jgi:hypothetical protein